MPCVLHDERLLGKRADVADLDVHDRPVAGGTPDELEMVFRVARSDRAGELRKQLRGLAAGADQDRGEVDEVDRLVAQDAAAQAPDRLPIAAAQEAVGRQLDHQRRPQHAAGEDLSRPDEPALEAPVLKDGQQAAGSRGRREHLARLGQARRHGLVAYHGLAGFEREHRVAAMQVRRRRDHDELDRVVGHEVVDRAVAPTAALTLGLRAALRVRIGDGDEPEELRERAEGDQVVLVGGAPEPDEADRDRRHRRDRRHAAHRSTASTSLATCSRHQAFEHERLERQRRPDIRLVVS